MVSVLFKSPELRESAYEFHSLRAAVPFRAEPPCYTAGATVNPGHVRNLFALLGLVLGVDAHGVDPRASWSMRVPELSKRSIDILGVIAGGVARSFVLQCKRLSSFLYHTIDLGQRRTISISHHAYHIRHLACVSQLEMVCAEIGKSIFVFLERHQTVDKRATDHRMLKHQELDFQRRASLSEMERLANARTLMEGMLGRLPSFLLESAGNVNLDLAGLLVLADLQGVAKWTALTGTSAWLDIFVIAPGLHKQAAAPDLCKGEYPACAAMTTGYVFRVENPATVSYLQRVGRPGHLTTLSVQNTADRTSLAHKFLSSIYNLEKGRTGPTVAYFVAAALTMTVLDTLISIGDLWGIATIGILMLVRFINVAIIRRRARPDWFGAPEPGVRSDLLVLLSQDRWIRIRGLTDDVKAVTSGTWFEECTPLQNVLLTFATLLTYFDVVMAANATQTGKLLLVFLLLANSGFLGLANYASTSMKMHDRGLTVSSGPKKYDRRLTLAKELIKEFGRTDCFVGMGMIQPHQAEDAKKSYEGAVTM